MTMTTSEAIFSLLIFGAFLGCAVLSILLLRVRRAIGGRLVLTRILTEGLIAFCGLVLASGAVTLARIIGKLATADGLVFARAVIVVSLFLVPWFGVVRLMRWLVTGDGMEAAHDDTGLSMEDEVVRLRILLERFLRQREDRNAEG
jgi:hypothetical protein